MKNVFYSILLFAGVCCAFAACSKGVYNANTADNSNLGVNPLTPLTSAQFDWAASGRDPMSANINGTPWTASWGTWVLDTTGSNVMVGVTGAKHLYLNLNQVYEGNIYPMSYNQFGQFGIWSDSVGAVYNAYASYYGNSGEVYISHNDSASITGLFYFKGVSATGQVVSITNGYFHFLKF